MKRPDVSEAKFRLNDGTLVDFETLLASGELETDENAKAMADAWIASQGLCPSCGGIVKFAPMVPCPTPEAHSTLTIAEYFAGYCMECGEQLDDCGLCQRCLAEAFVDNETEGY